MIAQVVRIQVQPGKVDEAISIFNSAVRPVVQEQKGFKDAYFLVDHEANRIVGFSLWETQADLSALGTNGSYQEQAAKLAAVFAAPPEGEIYEVAPA